MRGSFHLDLVSTLSTLDGGVHRLSVVLLLLPLLLLLLSPRLVVEDLCEWRRKDVMVLSVF